MKLERVFRELAWNSPKALQQATYRDLGRATLRVEYRPPPRGPSPTNGSRPGAAQAAGSAGRMRTARPPADWRVKFIYTYGGPDGGRWRKTIGPHSMSTDEPGSFKE